MDPLAELKPQDLLPPPRPVIGLLVAGAILILIQGLIELAVPLITGLLVLFSIPGIVIGIAVLLFLFTALNVGELNPGLGSLFIVLGAISLLFGGGFVIGGIFVIVAGSIEVFAGWVEEYGGLLTYNSRAPVVAQRATATSSPPVGKDEADPAGTPLSETGVRPPQIVVYAHCPSCNELNPKGAPRCARCGAELTKM